MWVCAKCGLPVYFAERRTSLGRDWHPGCLVCEECGKRLHSGQHAEHGGKPYCHVPCYSLLFGPTTYRHGIGGVATDHASPETRRRMTGGGAVPSSVSSQISGAVSSLPKNTGVHLLGREEKVPPRLSPLASPRRAENRKLPPIEIPASLPSPQTAPFDFASPPSSPSRLKCRKRLYDSQLRSNLPRDISKDQLFRAIESFNHFYTSPSSSVFQEPDDTPAVVAGHNRKFLVDYKERNGHFVLELVLKIRWGVKRFIQFLERDGVDPVIWRQSYLERLERSETTILELLERDSRKKRQSFRSVLNQAGLESRSEEEVNGESRSKSPKKRANHRRIDEIDASSPNPIPSTASMLESAAELFVDDGLPPASPSSLPRRLRSPAITRNADSRPRRTQSFKSESRPSISVSPSPSSKTSSDSDRRPSLRVFSFSAPRRSSAERLLSPAQRCSSFDRPPITRSTRSLPRSPMSAASAAADLKAESAKWKAEAERWRKKWEEEKERARTDDSPVTLRRPRPRQSYNLSQQQPQQAAQQRRPSINGHIYNPKTRIFIPEFGTVSTVRVDDGLTSADVVQLLLSKFRIENEPGEFMLYVVKRDGETYPIADDAIPLYIRLRLGPCHDESMIFLMERDSVMPIPAEVAMLMHLPTPMLERMRKESLLKEDEEEKRMRDAVRRYKGEIVRIMKERRKGRVETG